MNDKTMVFLSSRLIFCVSLVSILSGCALFEQRIATSRFEARVDPDRKIMLIETATLNLARPSMNCAYLSFVFLDHDIVACRETIGQRHGIVHIEHSYFPLGELEARQDRSRMRF